jgi:hypothetical protein
MNKDYYFVLVTSDKCPHCSSFKTNVLPSLQNEIILNHKNIEWIHINLPTYEFNETGYPKGIRSIIGWYPIMILIPADLWNKGDLTQEYNRVRIFNGKIQTVLSNSNTPRITSAMSSDYEPSIKGIKTWLETCKTMKSNSVSIDKDRMKFKGRERKLIKFNY